MVEVSLTVGKLDASLALLLTKDHHLIEFPTILLPNGVKAGSIVKLKCEQDIESEETEAKQFRQIQDEILQTFGKNLPESPIFKVKNVTQTLCVLEWEQLQLGTAALKNLILFKDNKKLGSIPQPLTSLTTKLSGLPINETFQFQLRLDTTAGVYTSEIIEVTTHKMTDLSGITVCLGDFTKNEQFTNDDILETLKTMGAHYPPQSQVKVDTTHFICTRENAQNPEYLKASEMNIPIVRPEWLKACEKERRVVGVRDFYVKDCSLPDILAKNYWGSKPRKESALPELPTEPAEPEAPAETEAPAEPAEPEAEPETEAKEVPEIKEPEEVAAPEIEPEEVAAPEIETEAVAEPEIETEAVPEIKEVKEDELEEVSLDKPENEVKEPEVPVVVETSVKEDPEITEGSNEETKEETKEPEIVDLPAEIKDEQNEPAAEEEVDLASEAPEDAEVDQEEGDEDEDEGEGEDVPVADASKPTPASKSKNKKKKKKGKK